MNSMTIMNGFIYHCNIMNEIFYEWSSKESRKMKCLIAMIRGGTLLGLT